MSKSPETVVIVKLLYIIMRMITVCTTLIIAHIRRNDIVADTELNNLRKLSEEFNKEKDNYLNE